MIALKSLVVLPQVGISPQAIEVAAESVIASIELAQYQIAEGRDWSAIEILAEVIRELRGQPQMLQ